MGDKTLGNPEVGSPGPEIRRRSQLPVTVTSSWRPATPDHPDIWAFAGPSELLGARIDAFANVEDHARPTMVCARL